MMCAVPCLRRAADVDGSYNPNFEVALQGEDDWVATHQDPSQPREKHDEEIPGIDDEAAPSGSKAKAKAAADEIPDIDALELKEDDEVGRAGARIHACGHGSRRAAWGLLRPCTRLRCFLPSHVTCGPYHVWSISLLH